MDYDTSLLTLPLPFQPCHSEPLITLISQNNMETPSSGLQAYPEPDSKPT